jgi:hypothetical protein
MEKKLIRFYLIFIILFASVSMLLPKLFPKSHKLFNYLWVKSNVAVKNQPVLAQLPYTGEKISILFIMDTAWETQYTVGYKLLSKHQMPGNISVIPDLIDQEKYITLNQLADLYIKGWDLLNGPYDNPGFANLIKELNKGRSWLKSHEFKRTKDVVVLSGNSYDNKTIGVLKDNNFKSVRTINEVWNTESVEKNQKVSVINIDSSTDPLWVMDWIDEAVESKKDIVFILHKLEKITSETGMQYEPQNFEKILNYISERKELMDVITYSQWLDRQNEQ